MHFLLWLLLLGSIFNSSLFFIWSSRRTTICWNSPNIFDKELEHALKISYSTLYFPRISFPFSTPPHMASLGAIYFFFFRYLNENYKIYKVQYLFLSKRQLRFGLFFSIVITLATVSKTGIAVLIFGFLADYFLKISFKNFLKMATILLLISLSFYFLVPLFESNPAFKYIFDRLFNLNAIDDFTISKRGSHLQIRFEAMTDFIKLDFPQKIFGIGYKNYKMLHYHSSPLTALIETGLTGFTYFFIILVYPIYLAIPKFFRTKVSSRSN